MDEHKIHIVLFSIAHFALAYILHKNLVSNDILSKICLLIGVGSLGMLLLSYIKGLKSENVVNNIHDEETINEETTSLISGESESILSEEN